MWWRRANRGVAIGHTNAILLLRRYGTELRRDRGIPIRGIPMREGGAEMRVSLIVAGLSVLVLVPYAIGSSPALFVPVRPSAEARPRVAPVTEWPPDRSDAALHEGRAVQHPEERRRPEIAGLQRANASLWRSQLRRVADSLQVCRPHSESCLRSVARASDRRGKATFAAIAERWKLSSSRPGKEPSVAARPARLPGYRDGSRKVAAYAIDLPRNVDRGSSADR
jgi:hypothetical protein